MESEDTDLNISASLISLNIFLRTSRRIFSLSLSKGNAGRAKQRLTSIQNVLQNNDSTIKVKIPKKRPSRFLGIKY